MVSGAFAAWAIGGTGRLLAGPHRMAQPPAEGGVGYHTAPRQTVIDRPQFAMKILHVADYLPGFHDQAGGAEYAALRTIGEQHDHGAELCTAVLEPDHADAHPGWPRPSTLRNVDRYAAGPAYAIKQLFLPADPLSGADLKRVLKQEKPDVVHFHNLHFAGLSPVLSAHRAGIPTLLTIYDYWLFCPSFMLLTSDGELCGRGHGAHCVDCIGRRRAPWLKPLKRLTFAQRPAVFGRVVAAVDQFITLSDASGALLQRHGVAAERLTTITQPAWQEALNAGPLEAPRRGRLLYVGWVEARKGLHVVVEALSQVATEFPDLQLDVLGMPANAEYELDIRQRIEQGGLGQRVRFVGKCSREELLAALRSTMLVLVPEQWENMSPVILTEAMAAGACVLASRVGGIPEFIQHGESGLLAERDVATSFAEQIRYAMHNPQAIEAMRHTARERAAGLFDPTTVAARHMTAYEAAIKQRSARNPD